MKKTRLEDEVGHGDKKNLRRKQAEGQRRGTKGDEIER